MTTGSTMSRMSCLSSEIPPTLQTPRAAVPMRWSAPEGRFRPVLLCSVDRSKLDPFSAVFPRIFAFWRHKDFTP